jgi:outer membrane biosynthesis protein TonB
MGTTALEINNMRKVILATLALSPMLLHAQATTPAQSPASSPTPVLQSKLIKPEELSAASDTTRTVPSATPRRVSSGVTPPRLIETVDIISDNAFPWSASGRDRKVVVDMLVDTNGKPYDLKIVESAGPDMDKNVLGAVSHYRFRPATLDHAPVAVPMKLEILMRSPAL